MDGTDISIVKERSIKGILALSSRTLILQMVAFFATFLLTVFLSPSIFGVFYVVSAVISFLAYFSDIGLAAALIQKKEELSREDLVSTFTIQQLLVIGLVVISLSASAAVARFYGLDNQGTWLFRALVVSFFLSSMKTIPSVILERRLDFKTLVIPQILETTGFYLTAVLLAWRGFGISSFTWAVLVRAVVGLISIYVLCPWVPGFRISRRELIELIHFGLPFQANSVLALIKDDLFTIFLGKILPLSQIGYIGWAKKWAEVPLRLIMDSVIRVTFPSFARLQHSREYLRKGIETTLFGLSLTVLPVTVIMIYAIRPLVFIIPKYIKWEPALFSFILFSLSSAISALSTPLTNTLNAIGKIKTTLKLMVMWTVLTWGLTIFSMKIAGFNGVSVSYLMISMTIVIVIKLLKEQVNFSFLKSVRYPVLGAVLMGCWLTFSSIYSKGILYIVISGLIGLMVYCMILWHFEKNRIGLILKNFFNRKV